MEKAQLDSLKAALPGIAPARWRNMAAGLEQLEQRLEDLLRNGLAPLQNTEEGTWMSLSRRLVDAQLPGAAARIRRIARMEAGSAWWPQVVMDELAALLMLAKTFRQLPDLPERLRHEWKNQAGISMQKKKLRETVQPFREELRVLGHQYHHDQQLLVRTTLLQGLPSQQVYTVLDFGLSKNQMEPELGAGRALQADAYAYPGLPPYRLHLANMAHQGAAASGPVPNHLTWENARKSYLVMRKQNPFLFEYPVIAGKIIPFLHKGEIILQDSAGHHQTIEDSAAWGEQLLALSGGYPLVVAGFFHPLKPFRLLEIWGG